MVPISALFSLVKSLSKSEKRYFRLLASPQKGDKLYLQLFDCLEKYVSFDIQLQAELKTLFPGSTIEPARKHLYRILMRSLRQFNTENEIDVRLFNQIQDSKILFNRGLINTCFEQLEKAKQLCLQYEKFELYIQAARQELQYFIQLQFEGLNELKLIQKQEKIRELLEFESTVHQHASLYEVLLLRYWQHGSVRNAKDYTRLNDLLLEEHQIITNRRFQSFESHQLHLNFQSVYFLMANDVDQSLKTFYDLDKLFQQHIDLWKHAPIYYFHLLQGILQTLRRMERYEEMSYFINQLKTIPNLSENLAYMVAYQVLEHEVYRAVNLKQYALALALIQSKAGEKNQPITRLPIQSQGQWWLTNARAWYGAGNYTNALKAINQALDLPNHTYNRLLYVCCRLMNLLIHTALNNKDYLFYELRSLERKLKADQSLYKAEKLVINLIKHWLQHKSLKEFLNKLNLLEEDPYEQQLVRELNLHDWVESMNKKA